jgi:hypothetical protein
MKKRELLTSSKWNNSFFLCLLVFMLILCLGFFTVSAQQMNSKSEVAVEENNPFVSLQRPILESNISFNKIGKIKPRNAKVIKASYLGIGCEGLDRAFTCYDCYKEYLGNLGVKNARFLSGWAKTEKEKGIYDFCWLDQIIDDCLGRGIHPWISTGFGNPIYEGGGSMQSSSKIPYSDVGLKAWENYIRALVTNYRTRVLEWEIWNEIDHITFRASTPEQYGDFYIRTARIIREIQPEGKIIALAQAYVGDTEFVRAFFNYMKEKGALDLIDKVSFHGYPKNPDDGFSKSQALIDLVHKYSNTIVVFEGETGCPSTKGSSGALSDYSYTELTQAKWILRRTLAHIGRMIQFSLFTLSEYHTGGPPNTKGILKIDDDRKILYPKQAYFGFQNLTSIFDSSVVAYTPEELKIATDKNSVIYAFTDSVRNLKLITFWNSGGNPSEDLNVNDAVVTLKSDKIKSPVLVDIRTGSIFRIPDSNIKNNNRTWEYHVPIYDSPVLICDKKFLLTRRLM